jgi:hypothetical protein
MAIAIQFIINGVKDILPEFAKIWVESTEEEAGSVILSLVGLI